MVHTKKNTGRKNKDAETIEKKNVSATGIPQSNSLLGGKPTSLVCQKNKINEKFTYQPSGKISKSRARSKKVCLPFPAIFTQDYIATEEMRDLYDCKAHANILAWINNEVMGCTDSEEDVKEIGRLIVEKILSTSLYLDELVAWSESEKNKLKSYIEKELPQTNISSLSNTVLSEKYLKYCDMYRKFHLKNTPVWWIGGSTIEKEFDQYIQENEISQDDLSILIEPLGYTLNLNKEEEDLLMIAAKAKSIENFSNECIPKNLDILLDNHVEEYSSIPFGYMTGVVWDKSFFIEKIKKILAKGDPVKMLDRRKVEIENKKKVQEKLFTKLNISNRLHCLILAVQKMSYLQDLKKTFQTKSHIHLQQTVLREIAKRLSVSVEDLGFMSPYEVRDALFSGKLGEYLEIHLPKRKESAILIAQDNSYNWIVEEDAVYFSKKHKLIFSQDRQLQLKGRVACSGLVRGVVKICKTSKDTKKVQTGDILVAPMTTPDYVVAMKLAGAIVTNEGGITCHAAIVSREMKKPCIIGTSIATKVLQDGDLVEVDANSGVVNIVKKAKKTKEL